MGNILGEKQQILTVLTERRPAMKLCRVCEVLFFVCVGFVCVCVFFFFSSLIMRVEIMLVFKLIFLKKVPVTLYFKQLSHNCFPWETPVTNVAVMALLVSWWTSQLILTPAEYLDCRIFVFVFVWAQVFHCSLYMKIWKSMKWWRGPCSREQAWLTESEHDWM